MFLIKIIIIIISRKNNLNDRYIYMNFSVLISLCHTDATLPGVTLLFNEPPDARKPSVRWRLYVFKAGEMLKGIQFFMHMLKFIICPLSVELRERGGERDLSERDEFFLLSLLYVYGA